MSSVVFISYNSASEYEIAHRLAMDLESAGRSVWIAPESIRAGESFPSAISRGLRSASQFLLLVTPAALGSRWVKAELDAAIDLEKKGQLRLIPIVIKETVLPPLLASYQSLHYADDYDAFLGRLGEFLKLELAHSVATRSRSAGTPEVCTALDKAMPLNDYSRSIFTALQLGAEHYDYMTNLVAPDDPGSIKLIVERELLRVGVTVFANPDDDEDRVHARLIAELDDNPQKVIGIVAVQPGKQVWMEMYRIAGDNQASRHLQPWRDEGSRQAEAPRIVHLRWKADHGDSALVQALDMFLRLLQENRTVPPLKMDAYVETTLRAVHRSADVLDVDTELPHAGSSSIVRLILSPHSIRIGVAVWTDNDPELDDVLADMNRELHANPSDISALIGIVPGRESGLQPHELRQRGQADGFLLRWNPKAGTDAIRWGLVQVIKLIDASGERHEDPIAAVFHQGRADAFLEVGMPDEALLETEDAILFNPSLTDAHALRAQALLALGRPAAALNAVEEALALDPSATGAYATQADTLLALGRPRDAVEAAERGLNLDRGFPVLHGIRADALVELDQLEDALTAAEEAVRLDAHDPRNHASKAIALLRLERFEEAIKAADAALALDPDEPTVGQVKEDALRKLKRRERKRPPPNNRR